MLKQLRFAVLIVPLATGFAVNSFAGPVFQFVQSAARISPNGAFIGQAGDVLAVLELDGLSPASDIGNLIGFSFTSEGNSLFGFGAGEYAGTFDVGALQFSPARYVVQDGAGGLAASTGSNTQADWTDLNPVPSSIFADLTDFHIQFGEIDQLILSGPLGLVADGNFVQVGGGAIPEPATLALVAAALFSITATRRRRPTTIRSTPWFPF